MASDPLFSADERRAVYRAIYERRDVRSYLPDPVPEDALRRVLEAAHRAPSVGFMQPWNFLVLRNLETRRKIHAHFLDVNIRAAEVWQDEQRQAYQALKLQGILDAPINVLVTCDPTRGGEHVLGRFTMPETDLYSTCLAVQNLWLAARAEGLGVGWMSLMEKDAVTGLLGIPEHVVPVAYLTLGYPVEFAREPMLSEVGWRQRMPLDQLVFDEAWGRIRTGDELSLPVQQRVSSLPHPLAGQPLTPPADAVSRNHDLTKPHGSLGVLEQLMLRVAGLQQTAYPSCSAAHLTLFAADHGVVAHRVSAYKPATTVKMVYSYLAGGAVVNSFAREQNVPIHVVDVGVDHDFAGARGLVDAKVRRATRDFTFEPAMTEDEYRAAIAAGTSVVEQLPTLEVLLLGEMGIGNSTSAAAVVAALLDLSPRGAIGPGTGVSGEARARKQRVVEQGLALHRDRTPDGVLANLGGYELAAMVGAIEAACARRALVLLDGFITGAAALVAVRRKPELQSFLVASHLSAEPAHAAVLSALQLRPLLSLDMRLGEGSGAVLALGLVRSACRVMRDVRTFEEANIERPEM
jgi:nicotinate-nucleotide--dimethylbenzimidazole phosphoribosyltransferase